MNEEEYFKDMMKNMDIKYCDIFEEMKKNRDEDIKTFNIPKIGKIKGVSSHYEIIDDVTFIDIDELISSGKAERIIHSQIVKDNKIDDLVLNKPRLDLFLIQKDSEELINFLDEHEFSYRLEEIPIDGENWYQVVWRHSRYDNSNSNTFFWKNGNKPNVKGRYFI